MNDAEIKDLYQRKVEAMRRRPSFGRGSSRARVRLGAAGMDCEVDHGDRLQSVDLPPTEGGGGGGHSPAQLMRASVACCLAMGYRIWGTQLGLPIAGVEVEMVCDYDSRAHLDVDPSVQLGWTRIAFHVTVTSGAPADDIRRLAAKVERLSPMLANLSPAIERTIALRIVPLPTTPLPAPRG